MQSRAGGESDPSTELYLTFTALPHSTPIASQYRPEGSTQDNIGCFPTFRARDNCYSYKVLSPTGRLRLRLLLVFPSPVHPKMHDYTPSQNAVVHRADSSLPRGILCLLRSKFRAEFCAIHPGTQFASFSPVMAEGYGCRKCAEELREIASKARDCDDHAQQLGQR